MTQVLERSVPAEVPEQADVRSRLRRWLHLAGIVPIVVTLAFALKVVVMDHHDHSGQGAWSRQDGATALEQWDANKFLNLLQPWIAPFDSGNAAYMMKDWPRAEREYGTALDKAPKREQCTVRINLSLTQEAVGDEAEQAGRDDEARKAWTQALGTLTAGDCPTRSGRGKAQSKQAESERQRLQKKLQQKQPPQNEPDQQNNQSGGSGDSDQQKNLDQRNSEGQKYKSDNRDLQDYGGYSDQPQW